MDESSRPKPWRTWMYSEEYPEGVIFVVGSPEYIECVNSGLWYDAPGPSGEKIIPENADGGPEQFVIEEEIQEAVEPKPKPRGRPRKPILPPDEEE